MKDASLSMHLSTRVLYIVPHQMLHDLVEQQQHLEVAHCHLTDFCGQSLENRLQTEQP